MDYLTILSLLQGGSYLKVGLFLLILLIGSGLVAAAADRMGHLAARRKVRFGKMRPRTVSTIIAVASGLLIMLVTLTAMLLVWRDFRVALSDYDRIKGQLATVEADLGGMQSRLSKAERDLSAAQDDTRAAEQRRNEAEDQRAQAEAELSATREELIDVTESLGEAQQELKSANRQVASAQAEKRRLDKEIASYQARMDELRGLVDQMRTDIEEGEIVLLRDTVLGYVQVPAGKPEMTPVLLQRRLSRISDELAALGLELSSEAIDSANEFIENYPYPDQDAMIMITAATNVLAGGDTVELAYSAEPLEVLVEAGETVMEVEVGTENARIYMLGAGERTVPLPEPLDAGGLEQLLVEMYGDFQQGARALGFVPDAGSGEVPHPMMALAEIAQSLAQRERPYTIKFTSPVGLNALDGMADMELTVNGGGG